MENDLQPELQDEPIVDDQLAEFSAALPDAPGVEAKPPDTVSPDYVTREQYENLQNQYASLGPIAEELKRNPQAAEQIRRQLILGDVAAPGTRAAQYQAPVPAAPPAPLTPDQLDRLRAAILENPVAFTDAVATAKANQIVAEQLAPIRAQGAQMQAQMYANNKAAGNPDEYQLVAPYFNQALAGVNLAQLQPDALGGFLEITYRAARGDAYAAANNGQVTPSQQYGPPQSVPTQRTAPPYGGSSGAVGSAATRPLVQRARASNQPRLPSEVIELAKRSGLTKQDFEKYGADVVDQLA